jgi:hypothetical protein
MIGKPDVLLTVLTATTSLAGLLLVVVGVVFPRSDPGEKKRGEPLKLVARAAVLPFALSVLNAMICAVALNGYTGLYGVVLALFYLSLLTTLGFGVAIILLLR